MTTPAPVTLELAGTRDARRVNADLMRQCAALSARNRELDSENRRLRDRLMTLAHAIGAARAR